MRATRYDTSRGNEYFTFFSPRAVSEPTMTTKLDHGPLMTRMRRSKTEVEEHHVHWSDKLRVILVPCRQDYRNRGFERDLWWDQKDYEQFKLAAKDEVLRAMESQHLDLFSAMFSLYQSDSDFGPEDREDGSGSDDGTEGSIRSAGSLLSLDNCDLKSSSEGASMKESLLLPSSSPSRENLSRKASWGSGTGSVDSQGSGSQSPEKRSINFLELRPEKGIEKEHRHHAVNAERAKGKSKKPIHPLALMAL